MWFHTVRREVALCGGCYCFTGARASYQVPVTDVRHTIKTPTRTERAVSAAGRITHFASRKMTRQRSGQRSR